MWRLINVPDAEATPEDLTDAELIGMHVLLANFLVNYSEVTNYSAESSVYGRAKEKLLPHVRVALANTQ